MSFARIVSSSSLEVIADLVGCGAGVGIVPAPVAERVRRKLKPVPGTPVAFDDHCLIYRVENKNVRAIQVIASAIKKSLR